MIDTIQCNLMGVSVHVVGNKYENEGIVKSSSELDISNLELRELLLSYFTMGFDSNELFEFTFSNGDLELNPIYTFVSRIFENFDLLHTCSLDIANQLYECSNHPNIKKGDFYLVYFSNLLVDDELMDAVGIYKVESQVNYIKLNKDNNKFIVNIDQGIDSRKLDKGCLILNTDSGTGYKICLVDNTNRASEARYWKEAFLNVKPSATGYFLTNDILKLTKDFVSKHLPTEFEVDRTDQADLLYKSMNFFNENEQFDKSAFMNVVFKEPELIDSFRQFENHASETGAFQIPNQFEISNEAVKKKARVFKSVLKLDKNFHVYIHGNRDMIEKGYDTETGKKYYKIYYEEEN